MALDIGGLGCHNSEVLVRGATMVKVDTVGLPCGMRLLTLIALHEAVQVVARLQDDLRSFVGGEALRSRDFAAVTPEDLAVIQQQLQPNLHSKRNV